MLAVRWYLRYGLSDRDVEELLAERGIIVDDVTIYRWWSGSPQSHGRRSAESASRWGPLVRRRDLPEGRRTLGVSVSGDRPARTGHRRSGLTAAGLAATRRFFVQALTAGRRPTEVEGTDTTDARPEKSVAGMRSCRTYAADTTNSDMTPDPRRRLEAIFTELAVAI